MDLSPRATVLILLMQVLANRKHSTTPTYIRGLILELGRDLPIGADIGIRHNFVK